MREFGAYRRVSGLIFVVIPGLARAIFGSTSKYLLAGSGQDTSMVLVAAAAIRIIDALPSRELWVELLWFDYREDAVLFLSVTILDWYR